MNISSYIQTFNLIPPALCKKVIGVVDSGKLETHQWTKQDEDYTAFSFNDKEPKTTYATDDLANEIIPYVKQGYFDYINIFKPNIDLIKNLSAMRFNKYEKGSVMRAHYDHIHSVFDGKKRGIPVLSFILSFNEDYQGGAVAFNLITGRYILNLKAGDVVMFPSNFMYEHEVEPIIEGNRYTAVAWGY